MASKGLERRITFTRATDERMADRGISGVEMHWYLVGAQGAIHWHVLTNWQLEDVQNTLDDAMATHALCHPIPSTVAYHAREQRGNWTRNERCEVIGGKCFYSDSPMQAVHLFQLLTKHGDGAVWEQMYTYFLHEFQPEEQTEWST